VHARLKIVDNDKLPALKAGELASLLAKKNLRTKAIDKLEKCLDATYTMKNEDGKIQTFIDFKTIVAAIQTILNYTDGRPVERREVVTRKATTLEELQAQAKNSPELRKSLQALLEAANPPTVEV
jgi:hypothetical protein